MRVVDYTTRELPKASEIQRHPMWPFNYAPVLLAAGFDTDDILRLMTALLEDDARVRDQ